MKTILIFSNPFGYGPSGKALSIANYINEHATDVSVCLCGSSQMRLVAENKYRFIKTDERNEDSIAKAIRKIKGEKYVISSQNRFAIKVAKNNNIPCAFLDGLAWFWKHIPEDHFLADIIFWLNYPNITKKIPHKKRGKVFIVHGITENLKKPIKKSKKDDILFYVGGCNNPLTPIPTHYLDLVSKIITFVKEKGLRINLVSDPNSRTYLKKYPSIFKMIKTYKHKHFIIKLSRTRRFITNGGQTAALEAFSLGAPISFFLPINLSQFALIDSLTSTDTSCLSLRWQKYIKIPEGFSDYAEKDAITFLNLQSKNLLKDKRAFKQLCEDFKRILLSESKIIGQKSFLQNLGSTGTEDIYKILKDKWGIF